MIATDRIFIALLIYLAAIIPCANEEKFGTGRIAASIVFILIASMWIVSVSF